VAVEAGSAHLRQIGEAIVGAWSASDRECGSRLRDARATVENSGREIGSVPGLHDRHVDDLNPTRAESTGRSPALFLASRPNFGDGQSSGGASK
jgi:hypothetical protein